MRTSVILNRAEERVGDLIAKFPECMAAFEDAKVFTGPSLHFHLKTIDLNRASASKVELLGDPLFFDMLYATLTAWGMHRSGVSRTKLLDLELIRESFLQQKDSIREIEKLSLRDLDDSQVEETAFRIWAVLAELRVGIGHPRIIANTKALHHLLPDLVPPIDRQYTLRFFYKNPAITQEEALIFVDIYLWYHKIMNERRREIECLRAKMQGMNTSDTKIIDNAITGYITLFDQQQRLDRKAEMLEIEGAATQVYPIAGMIDPGSVEAKGENEASQYTYVEQIVLAVRELVMQGKTTFSRREVRDQAGIPKSLWDGSFSAMFQAMRDDHPGGAPAINKKYRGIFHRVAPGRYVLSEYGVRVLFGG